MRIHLICPVRNAKEDIQKEIDEYALKLENEGHTVHNPKYAVDQDDPTGWNICLSHLKSMEISDRIDVFWDSNSFGSHFDLGMVFALRIPVKIVKIYNGDVNVKSYTKVLAEMEKRIK